MIAFLVSAVLATIVSMFIRAHALTITKQIVMGWVRLYSAVAPKEDRHGRRAEVWSHLHELIDNHQKAGYAPGEIAVRILEIWVMGMADDVSWCIPFAPGMFADRVEGWGGNLRHYRIPNAMIAGVATLGLMNYSLFSSPHNQSLGTWLFANTIVISMTVLLWKHNHPVARRIFQAWLWIAMAGAIAVMGWMTIHYQLYASATFKILMLAMAAVLPAIIVVDKSWRQRLFRGRWWLIPICWAPIIAGALAGSSLIVHSITPLLEMWAAMVLLVVGMFIVYGFIALAAYVLCWLGIRGSSGGLSLMAAGLRRLR
jgi:hypothetical protein